MTLSSAMNTAVSGLKAQSQALSVISNNLANSSTTGYKAASTKFSSLVTQAFSGTSYNGAGVTASTRQNVASQGTISSTSNSTDMAISGDGMFVVSGGDGTLYFTRNGEFDTDDEGYLVSGEYQLMGWPTNADGTLTDDAKSMTASALEPINTNKYIYSANPTTTVGVYAALGPDTDISTTADPVEYTKTIEVYDSLGAAHTVTMTFAHTATDSSANTSEWTVSFSSDDGTTTLGEITLTFDGDGNLSSASDASGTVDPANLTLDFDWSNAASDSSITLNLSNITMTGSNDGVTLTKTTNDGFATGKLSGVSVSEDGTVTANYDNGQSVAIYKIAVATFSNYNGLQALSDTLYQVTGDSGPYTLNIAGEGSAGTISASALESSTVDTADEFTKMIVAQQAYSAASQVVSTAKEMYETLIATLR